MPIRLVRAAALGAALILAAPARAQAPAGPARFEGTLVTISAAAEIEASNDEALASFYLEVQDADLARAQSQLNQRVADGVATLKRADPSAQIETAGYGSYPIYAAGGGRKVVGWRVRQGVSLRTTELASLPKTVAAAQQQLALGGIGFRLSRAARDRLDAELIARAYANLSARIAAAAQAMGVPPARVRIEEVHFGTRGDAPPIVPMARAMAMGGESVAEPSFDAGLSTQRLDVTAKVRFLQP
ncbi:MAG: SIMPL domain-containing protein [Burkholderiaceae bacterium]|nr:SIMPL domain-containing protein [Burkholderiaceae bacterium]